MRRLALPLVLLAVALAGCGGDRGAPAEARGTEAAPSTPIPPDRDPILIVPVPAKAAEGDHRYAADWSFDLKDAEHMSVHVHVIPPGQMVPIHRHPENWELTFVAGGEGEWSTVVAGSEGPERTTTLLRAGQAAVAPPGAVHGVRNRGTELLAAVVVHRPRFGQNWYLPEAEVTSTVPASPLGESAPAVPEGWTVGWTDGGDAEAEGDRVLLFAGAGSVSFEEREVPVAPGTVAIFPPGVPHISRGRALALVIPRP